MASDAAQARPARLNIGYADNNKDLPPPPPPKSPRYNAFQDNADARHTPSYSSHNSPSLSIPHFHSPFAAELDGAFARPATASPPPEPQQSKYIPYAGEIYELPAMEEPASATTPATPSASTPLESAPNQNVAAANASAPAPDPVVLTSVSPVLTTIPKRVPVRKPVPAPTASTEQIKPQPEPELDTSTESREETADTNAEGLEKETDAPKSPDQKPTKHDSRAESLTAEDKELPPPPPAKDDQIPKAAPHHTSESSLLKRRNPSVRLSSLELGRTVGSKDDDKLEVLSSAVYTPPTRTPRSANKSRATTPLLESGTQSPLATDAAENTRSTVTLSDVATTKRPETNPVRAQTIDIINQEKMAGRVAPPRSSTSDSHGTHATRVEGVKVPEAKTIPELAESQATQSNKSASYAAPSEKATLVDISRPLSDGTPSLVTAKPYTIGGEGRETTTKGRVQQGQAGPRQNERLSDPLRAHPVGQPTSSHAAGMPRYRAISPDDQARDPRRPGASPMTRAMSPDYDGRPRPVNHGPMDRSLPGPRAPMSRPGDRPMSPEEYANRQRVGNRPGPGMRPMSPEDGRPRPRAPYSGPQGRPMSPDDLNQRPRMRRQDMNGRPMSPDREPGRMRPMHAAMRVGGPVERPDRRYEQMPSEARRGPAPNTYENHRSIDHTNGQSVREHAAISHAGAQRAMSPDAFSSNPVERTASTELTTDRKVSTGPATDVAVSDARKQYSELVQRSTTLHERYDALRTERQRLATAITATLRGSQPTQDLVDSLANQHLALNTINSSIDICIAKLKAIDCRKEEVVSRLLLSATIPMSSGSSQEAQRPSSVPIGKSRVSHADDERAASVMGLRSSGAAAEAVETGAQINRKTASQASSAHSINGNGKVEEFETGPSEQKSVISGNGQLPSATTSHETTRLSDPASLKSDSPLSAVETAALKSKSSKAKAGKTADDKAAQNYADHDFLDSYYDD